MELGAEPAVSRSERHLHLAAAAEVCRLAVDGLLLGPLSPAGGTKVDLPAFIAQSGSSLVSVLRELNDQIARLEICSEQLRMHLRSVGRDTVEAAEVRSDLLTMLQRLAVLKDQRQRREVSLELEAV